MDVMLVKAKLNCWFDHGKVRGHIEITWRKQTVMADVVEYFGAVVIAAKFGFFLHLRQNRIADRLK